MTGGIGTAQMLRMHVHMQSLFVFREDCPIIIFSFLLFTFWTQFPCFRADSVEEDRGENKFVTCNKGPQLESKQESYGYLLFALTTKSSQLSIIFSFAEVPFFKMSEHNDKSRLHFTRGLHFPKTTTYSINDNNKTKKRGE